MNKIRKILSGTLMIIVLLTGVLALTGCDKGENKNNLQEQSANLEGFEIAAKFGKLTFNMPKDTGYEFKTEGASGTLTHKDNKSTIAINVLNTSKSSILMKEKDFSSSSYSDYKELEIGGHQAYTIRKTNNFSVQYGILLDEYDKDHNKNYGVKIVVSKNGIKTEEFDPSAYVESEAFKTLLNSLKFDAANAESTESTNDKNTMKNYGEFESRADGISDKKGYLFIKKYDSPKPDVYKAEQRNDNVGIDNYLWYTNDKRQFQNSGIEVRIFPQEGTYNNIDEYKNKKGSQYTWSKTTIAGKEYDTYVFANSTPAAKYSKYYGGAFMVGNRVVEFSYNMYAEVPDQDLGDTFFNQVLNSIEYSKSFK